MQIDVIKVRETLLLDATAEVRITGDGYLTATPRVARTGIQIYLGKEVGRPQMDKVRVWRPEEEVFNTDAMRSLAHRPITNDHPREMVNSKNWKKYSVGQVGDEVARDGEFIRVPIALMDDNTIQDIKGGKKELSLGYSANLEWRAGVTPSNEAYDAVQTGIRINHLAVVDAARGGTKLVIGDDNTAADPPKKTGQQDEQPTDGASAGSKRRKKAMNDQTTLRAITIDGINLEVPDIAASVFDRALKARDASEDELKKKIKELEGKLEEKSKDAAALKETGDKAIAAKDAEIVTLKKQLEDAAMSPTKLDALVKDRSIVIAKAHAVIGDKLVVDGKTDADIRRQVVDANLGDAAKGWSDDAVKASFDTLTAKVDLNKTQDGQRHSAADHINRSFASPPNNGQLTDGEKSYDKYKKNIGEAWKGPSASH